MTYAGAVYDQATGLYLMGARYYDPVLQRFITAHSHVGAGSARLQSRALAASPRAKGEQKEWRNRQPHLLP